MASRSLYFASRAGTGPEREARERRVAHHGLQERVRFLGFVPDEELLDLYAGALAVYYAPYDEDYGYVTVEAFKSGKPVLTTTDSGGPLEFVTDGETGIVTPSSAPRRMASRLDELAREPERAAALGAAGRERVSDITWDRVVAELVEGRVPPPV